MLYLWWANIRKRSDGAVLCCPASYASVVCCCTDPSVNIALSICWKCIHLGPDGTADLCICSPHYIFCAHKVLLMRAINQAVYSPQPARRQGNWSQLQRTEWFFFLNSNQKPDLNWVISIQGHLLMCLCITFSCGAIFLKFHLGSPTQNHLYLNICIFSTNIKVV